MCPVLTYSAPTPILPRYLRNDPVHAWRAQTGIELIHREPSLEELNRIRQNWLLMSRRNKILSDIKSRELFGVTNLRHYTQLKKLYR